MYDTFNARMTSDNVARATETNATTGFDVELACPKRFTIAMYSRILIIMFRLEIFVRLHPRPIFMRMLESCHELHMSINAKKPWRALPSAFASGVRKLLVHFPCRDICHARAHTGVLLLAHLSSSMQASTSTFLLCRTSKGTLSMRLQQRPD